MELNYCTSQVKKNALEGITEMTVKRKKISEREGIAITLYKMKHEEDKNNFYYTTVFKR